MKILLFILVLQMPTLAYSQKHNFFNLDSPTEQPVLFAPGIVSDEFGNRDMAISPAGDELFYTLQYLSGRSFSTIMRSVKVGNTWSKPEVATFCGKYNDLEPAFSPDGKKLYFVSNRPLNDTSSTLKDYDIWFVERQKNNWSKPQNLGAPINSTKDEFYPSVTKSGNIYFTRNMGETDEDIVVCNFHNNTYDTAVSLPKTINSMGGEFNAFVDPGEKYIIFTGYKRKDNYGSGDLFISFKNAQGEWSESKNLGKLVNGAGLTYCPFVSPDKKYFFFSSSRGYFKAPFSKQQNLKTLQKLIHSPLNGWDNIFWMDASEVLKPQVSGVRIK